MRASSKPAACGCAVMALAVIGVRVATAGHADLVRLAAAVFAGGVVYTAVVLLVFRARIMTLVGFIKSVRARPPPSLSVPDPA